MVFDRLDQLELLDRDDPTDEVAIMDAEIDAAGTLLDELVALLNDGAMAAYDPARAGRRTSAQRRHGRPGAVSRLHGTDTLEVNEDTFRGGLADDVRRLVAVRFADRDPGLPAAADRALAVADTLVNGDLPLSKAVDDPRQELVIWVTMVAVWRANSG